MASKLLVIGAGPVGIEMAVLAVRSGLQVTMLERASDIAANVREWGQVELFSPNELNMSQWGISVLHECSAQVPATGEFISGTVFIKTYLEVLVNWLKTKESFKLRLNSRVESIGRGKFLKYEDIGGLMRKGTGFRVMVVDTSSGGERFEEGFRYLVDASGTYNQPAWAGMGGVPAMGERALVQEGRVIQHIPNFEMEKERFINKTTAVVGTGASAITVIARLKKLSEEGIGRVKIVWICRKGKEPYTRVQNDVLPQRDALYALGNELSLAASSKDGNFCVQFLSHCCLTAIMKQQSGSISLTLAKQQLDDEGQVVQVDGIDTVVSCCGFKPDDTIWAQLHVHQCYASAAPMKLAQALLSSSGAGGDCLKQVSHGPDTMLNPEPGMFVVGMKSYGTGSAFLMKVGHQQVGPVKLGNNELFQAGYQYITA